MILPERQLSSSSYRYGFNSPYAYAENDVISSIDVEGSEKFRVTMRAYIPFEEVVLDPLNYSGAAYVLSGYNQLKVHGDTRTEPVYDLKSAGFNGENGNTGYRVEITFIFDTDVQVGESPVDQNALKWNTGKSMVWGRKVKIDAYQDNGPGYKANKSYGPWVVLYEGYAGKEEMEVELFGKTSSVKAEGYKHLSFVLETEASIPGDVLKLWGMRIFPEIDTDLNIQALKSPSGEITIFGSTEWDGFPAIEVFFENLETGEVQLFENVVPDSPNDGINLAPGIGDEVKKATITFEAPSNKK
jgi:hypothetical protein